ncbi:MAG: Hint domain-containing protein, partial [Pseudomonadota bacterium]
MTQLAPLFRFATYPADALIAMSGANEGDPIGLGDAALPGDTYRLSKRAEPRHLAIADSAEQGPTVGRGSAVGRPGEPLNIAACHTFMGPRGELIDVLVLERTGHDGVRIELLPLTALKHDQEYELIGCEVDSAPDRFGDIASVSFLAGTHVTLANGSQAKVQDLRVGDRVLTRNHGAKPIRWIAQQTRRAIGAAAPIRISAGTLNTARDLRLTPQHRLFIWQRRDEVGAGRAEVMVKADLLVNGTTVIREEGGHVDSYQLVFDTHEIIYAEGIAVESL